MLYSMTGFGRATVETASKKITVEIKSLNSKQMDLAVRLPHAFRSLEPEVRNSAARLLQRGKVDLVVTVEPINDTTTSQLNISALKAYKGQILQISDILGLEPPADWYNVLLRLPDVLASESASDADSEESAKMMHCVDSALDNLMKYRRTEGIKLEDFFSVRIQRITDLLAQITRYEPERIERIRSRIAEGLAKLNNAECDAGRLEQEMIYYIEKLDINEEKQRLTQHLSYFMETMAEPNGGQGKKLGFISQEMTREINTMGSKSNHADMQRIVVKMKDELEQIKEQVLNVM